MGCFGCFSNSQNQNSSQYSVEELGSMEKSDNFTNELIVDYLSIKYPDGFHEMGKDEDSRLAFWANSMSGDVAVKQDAGILNSDDDACFFLRIPKSDADVTQEAVLKHFNQISDTFKEQNDSKQIRVSKIAHLILNGNDALMLDTTLFPEDAVNDKTVSDQAIIYALFVDNRLVGEVMGEFVNGSYDKNQSLYESIFASATIE